MPFQNNIIIKYSLFLYKYILFINNHKLLYLYKEKCLTYKGE